MKLYDRETSGNAYKIRLLLGFLGLEFESIPVFLKSGKNDVDEAYLCLNPRGQIPTLDDGGVILWGSTAILVYLAMRYDPVRRWMPLDPRHAGEVVQWLEFAQNDIAEGLFRSRAIQRFNYSGELTVAREAGERALAILERRLSQADWLAGPESTIADIACFPYVALAHEGGLDVAGYRHVSRWVARFRSLEHFVAMPGLTP